VTADWVTNNGTLPIRYDSAPYLSGTSWLQNTGMGSVLVSALCTGTAFNARGEDVQDTDAAGRVTENIDDDAGWPIETIQNYAVDGYGQPLTDPDTNLTMLNTYHVMRQITSSGTVSPNEGLAIPATNTTLTFAIGGTTRRLTSRRRRPARINVS
jgi:hypothetical protein